MPKHRKRYKKTNKDLVSDLIMFSNNCEGLSKKKDSLTVELKRTKSTLFTLQETHLGKKGKLQIDNMQIYEAIRKKEHGLILLTRFVPPLFIMIFKIVGT